MVVFDCERMKYPNTGLYVFCDQVASNLVKQRLAIHDRLCLFVPSRFKGNWGPEVLYRPVHMMDKLYLHCSKDVHVWHSAHQQSPFIPPKGVRQVLTVHDLNFLYEKPPKRHHAYLSALQKRIDRADHIVAISESTKRDLMDNLNLSGKFVEVIYNGLNHFDGDIVPPLSRPDGPFLFSVGTVLPKKNFHVLPALLKGNDLRLVIAGNRSSYENRIMEEAAKYGAQDRVSIVGPVTDAVKMACCAVAEEISTQSAQQARSGAAAAAVCGVKAESTDGYSVTYGGYAEMQAAQKVRLWDAAGLYLPPSDPLRYAGFYQRGPGCG